MKLKEMLDNGEVNTTAETEVISGLDYRWLQ